MAMAETKADRPLLDLSDPRFLSDPYPFYRLLRERAPVWRSPTGLWVLSRHSDIAAVLKDSRFGHDFESKLSDPRGRDELLEEPVFRGLRLSMLVRDPPDHTRLRGLVAKAFTARRLEAMRPKIEALISALLHVRDEHDGRLTHDELAANIGLLFGAGHETTTHLIGNGLLALHRNPDQWRKLVADPMLAGNAVEELLRFDSSVQLTSRKAFEDVTLDGTILRRGESVMCLLGAANRDPEVYADPEKLDITRAGVRAISFGGGIHHCLGAQLARIEGEIVFRRLAQRLPKLTLEDKERPTWKPTITLRGLIRLPARWDQQVA